jgi:hypothetical protein
VFSEHCLHGSLPMLNLNELEFELIGVVEDLSALRDRGVGFKTRSRPLTFTKAVTEFSEPYTLWGSHCANEFYRILSCKRS